MNGHGDPTSEHAGKSGAWSGSWAGSWWAVLALVGGLTLVRMVWTLWVSPLTLAEDEAHYWEWSNRLAWSYHTKGPGVAWTIWASTSLFGDSEWAIRLPAILSGAIGALAIAGLGRRVFDDARVGFFAAALWLSSPGAQITGVLMTIDGPLLACWGVACWAWWAATRDRAGWAWAAWGLAFGAGFLFKYTILLLLPVFLLDVLCSARARDALRASAPMAAAGVVLALLGLVPVLVWNAGHEWVTVTHLLGHLGAPGGEGVAQQDPWRFDPVRTIEFVGLQFAAAGPALVPMLAGAWMVRRKAGRVGVVLGASAAVLGFYLLVSVAARVEVNWTLGAFVPMAVLGGWAVVRAKEAGTAWLKVSWGASAVCGVALLLLILGSSHAESLPVIGDRIPVGRLTGMRAHAQDVDRRLAEIEAERDETPFVITDHYGRASQLAFYLPGNPIVYCGADLLGGSSRQYRHWAETDMTNPETLALLEGRPALIVTSGSEPIVMRWGAMFERVEDLGPLDAEPKEDRTALLGIGFLGTRVPGLELLEPAP